MAGAAPSLKTDTRKGFRPLYDVQAFHAGRSLAIARLDGELAGFGVHPRWTEDLRRAAYVANAQASASIEGNPLTLEDAEAVLARFDAKHRARTPPDEREIVQHVEYFRSLEGRIRDDAADLTVEEVERVHTTLLQGVLPESKRIGEVRGPKNDARVFIGTTEGTPPERVRQELQSLIAWYYGPGATLALPIRVAIWFHEFEAIHPFRDGNGRVGRALTHRLFATDGLPNSLLVALDRPFNEDREEYYRALATVQATGRYEAWVGYFLAALQDAYEPSRRTVATLSSLPQGLSGATRAVMEHILSTGRREVRTGALAAALGYRPITVTVALSELAGLGFLKHNGKRGRASAYEPGPKGFAAPSKAAKLR